MSVKSVKKAASLNDIINLTGSSGLATFNGGLFCNSGGTPYLVGGMPRGTSYFVDAATPGVNTNDGKSWGSPFLTMAKAFSVVATGDTIYFRGTITEQLVTPALVSDVAVYGVGNRPRHADSHPAGTAVGGATWKIPGSPTTAALVKVEQPGWTFDNILWAGPTDHGCIWLFRDNGADAVEKNASHCVIRNCRFASGLDGIRITEVADTLIENNDFNDLTGYAVKGVAGSGIANPLRGKFLNNTVIGCANGFYVSCNQWLVQDNKFDDGETPATTVVLDVLGAGLNGANNFVVHNYFQTTTANFNSPDIVGSATDVWTDNMAINTAAAGTSGISETGNPA